jgi:glycosyltransferase involved in cell wall biosynthesis
LRDHAGLKNAIETFAANQELRQEFGAAGREFVRERFSVERMVEDTYQIYLRLLRQHDRLNSSRPIQE